MVDHINCAQLIQKLMDHIKCAPSNASYTPVGIQNEIIECIREELKDKILSRVKKCRFYVIMADETTEISSIEQLSVCFHYYDTATYQVREDFIAFLAVLDQEYASGNDDNNDTNNTIVAEKAFPKTTDDFLEICDIYT